MTAPLSPISFISGEPVMGTAVTLPCRVLAAPRRTLGLFGDTLQVAIKASAWPVEGWVAGSAGVYTLTYGLGADVLSLGGYTLASVAPGTFGVDLTDPDGEPEAQSIILTLVTKPARWRDARGGAIRAKVFNPVKADGSIDTASPDYRTNSQLVALALGSIGVAYEALPSSLDTLQPPAAIDWSFARPMHELEALLARIGHAAAFTNDGSKVRIVRLPRGGDDVAVPSEIEEKAEPYELISAPTLRGSKFVVTSGRVRTIALTWRTAEDMEWVWFDPKTGRWLNAAQTETLYPGTPNPDDLAALRAGPGKSPQEREHFQRIFRALRLKGDDLKKASRFTPLPADNGASLDVGGAEVNFGAVAAFGFAQAAFEISSGVFRNEPDDLGQPHVRVDVQAHAGDGVFRFEQPLFYVDPSNQGGYGDAHLLGDDKLYVAFAHEVESDDFLARSFTRGFVIDEAGQLQQMTDADTIAAMNAPETVVVEAPFLRRIVSWPRGEQEYTPVNDTALEAIALNIARSRVGKDQIESGVIEVRGLINVQPGDWGGAVSSVTWNRDRVRTIITVNEHETPGSEFDALEADAMRSIASGLSRFSLPGSAVELSDVRSGSAEDETAGASVTRGKEAASGARATHAGPRTSTPAVVNSRWLARPTGSSSVGANRFAYQWQEVVPDETPGTFRAVANGRTHATHGLLYPGGEAYNTASGVIGNGVNRANLPPGWSMQPIANQVLEVIGPFGAEGARWCVCVGVTNSDDGTCAATDGGSTDGDGSAGDCGCGCGEERAFGPAARGIDEAYLVAGMTAAWGGVA